MTYFDQDGAIVRSPDGLPPFQVYRKGGRWEAWQGGGLAYADQLTEDEVGLILKAIDSGESLDLAEDGHGNQGKWVTVGEGDDARRLFIKQGAGFHPINPDGSLKAVKPPKKAEPKTPGEPGIVEPAPGAQKSDTAGVEPETGKKTVTKGVTAKEIGLWLGDTPNAVTIMKIKEHGSVTFSAQEFSGDVSPTSLIYELHREGFGYELHPDGAITWNADGSGSTQIIGESFHETTTYKEAVQNIKAEKEPHKEVLAAYKLNDHTDINMYLRSKEEFLEYRTNPQDQEQAIQSVSESIDKMTQSVEAYTVEKTVVAYRGIGNPEAVMDELDTLQVGDYYADSGFQSTSTNIRTSMSFSSSIVRSERGRPADYIIEHKLTPGTKAIPVDHALDYKGPNNNETEVILQRGTVSQVTGIRDVLNRNGNIVRIITCEPLHHTQKTTPLN